MWTMMVMSAKITVSRNRFRAWEAKSGVSDKFPHIRELCICNWPGASISILSALPTSGVCYIPFLQHLEPKMPSKERLPQIWEKAEYTTLIALLTYIDPIQSFPPLHWTLHGLHKSSEACILSLPVNFSWNGLTGRWQNSTLQYN